MGLKLFFKTQNGIYRKLVQNMHCLENFRQSVKKSDVDNTFSLQEENMIILFAKSSSVKRRYVCCLL